MKKILAIFILMILSSVAYSQNEVLKPRSGEHDNEIMTPKPNVPTWDTISKKIDTLKKVSNEVYTTVKDGMKEEGVRTYMRNHADVFLPVVVSIIFFLVWLGIRARARNS